MLVSKLVGVLCVLAALGFTGALAAGEVGGPMPRPDGKEADVSRPVRVYVLLGQSNMLGMGKVTGGEGSLENAVRVEKRYPYLVDEAGNWTVRKDVRNVRVMLGKGAGCRCLITSG